MRDTKRSARKRKLEFENYKNCLVANQLKTKINYLEKYNIDLDNIKEFIKSKSIFKIQQRFKSERRDFFNEEINKIALSLTDDERMQSIDWIETYGISQDLVNDKEEIKYSNIIKRYKK